MAAVVGTTHEFERIVAVAERFERRVSALPIDERRRVLEELMAWQQVHLLSAVQGLGEEVGA